MSLIATLILSFSAAIESIECLHSGGVIAAARFEARRRPMKKNVTAEKRAPKARLPTATPANFPGSGELFFGLLWILNGGERAA